MLFCLSSFSIRRSALSLSLLLLVSLSGCLPFGANITVTSGTSSPSSLTLTGPSQVAIGYCGGPIQLTSVDNSGTATGVTANTTIDFSGQGNGSFYSDNNCTQAITSIEFYAGSQSSTVYFKDSVMEGLTLSASASGLGSVSLQISFVEVGNLTVVGGSPLLVPGTQVLTLKNTGGLEVVLESISPITAPFSIVSGAFPGNCPNPLPAGGSCSLTVGFQSTTVSSASEAVTFTYNVGNGDETLSLTLQGMTAFTNPSSGTVDTTFGSNGDALTQFSTGQVSVSAVALQNNGKIVVAGAVDGQFAVLRYNSNGSLDTTFGNSGLVQVPSFPQAFSVAVQSDQKIVAVGEGNGGFGVVRLLSTGALDPSFPNGGAFTTSTGILGGMARSVLIQSDGSILVAGHDYTQFVIAKYQPTGLLDSTFGRSGVQYTSISNISLAQATSMALQSDGKIVVAGTSYNFGNTTYITAVRYTCSGMLDSSFNGTGIQTIYTGQPLSFASSVAVQPSGAILIGGDAEAKSLVVRLTSAGIQDSNFYNGGIETVNYGSYSFGRSLSVLSNGAFVLVGFNQISGSQQYEFALAQFTVDGAPDTTLNGTGMLSYPIGTSSAFMEASALQSNGELVVVGNTWDSIALTRLTP